TRPRHSLRGQLRRRGIAVPGAAMAAGLAAHRASGAALPLELVGRTWRAAAGFVGGAPGTASPAAVALAQGALRTMRISPVKLLCGLCALAALLLGAALLPGAVHGDDPPPTVAVTPLAARAEARSVPVTPADAP